MKSPFLTKDARPLGRKRVRREDGVTEEIEYWGVPPDIASFPPPPPVRWWLIWLGVALACAGLALRLAKGGAL